MVERCLVVEPFDFTDGAENKGATSTSLNDESVNQQVRLGSGVGTGALPGSARIGVHLAYRRSSARLTFIVRRDPCRTFSSTYNSSYNPQPLLATSSLISRKDRQDSRNVQQTIIDSFIIVNKTSPARGVRSELEPLRYNFYFDAEFRIPIHTE